MASIYRCEDIVIDLERARVQVGGQEATLTTKEVSLLGYLAQTTQPTIFSAAETACPAQMYNRTAGGVCETELAPWRVLALVHADIRSLVDEWSSLASRTRSAARTGSTTADAQSVALWGR